MPLAPNISKQSRAPLGSTKGNVNHKVASEGCMLPKPEKQKEQLSLSPHFSTPLAVNVRSRQWW